MSRLCVDTSAYSRFRRGHDPRLIELLDTAEWIGIPTITLGELRTGFLLGSRAAENEEELQQFLHNPAVDQVPIDDRASHYYAAIVRDLRRTGRPIPTNDIWIAAAAASEAATVVTYDEHFRSIERVAAIVLQGPK